MKAVGYLVRRILLNHVKQTFRKPVLLLLYALLIGFLVFSMLISRSSFTKEAQSAITGYSAILTGAFLLIGMLTIWNGLKQGSTLFNMADVNLLFTSPVNPRTTLIMGVTRQAGIIVLASVFMLFQYPNMKMNGLGVNALIGLVIAYALLGICANLLAAVAYAYCAGITERRKRLSDAITILFAIAVIGAVIVCIGSTNIVSSLSEYLGAKAWEFLPFFGWARGLATSFALSDWPRAILFTALELAGIGVCVLALLRTDMDYFEDVLISAERITQLKENAKEGKFVEQGEVLRKVKREAGPLWGRKSFVFTGRIMREQSRNGISLFDAVTACATAGPIMGLIFFDSDMIENIGLLPIFSLTLWLMIFVQLTTGYVREFLKPYIYLAPQNPFLKLVAILMPSLMKSCVDGVLFAGSILLFYKVSVYDALASWFVYISIITLFSAGYLIVQRILGSAKNRALIMVVYIFMLIFMCVPGIVFSSLLAKTFLMGYLLFALFNMLGSLVIIFLCRGMLHQMES